MTIKEKTKTLFGYDRPFAIAMWDFSWLERRWTGGGFENWDDALSELKERGYDAVRIDPYPHLMIADTNKEWTMIPIWTEHAWGSPRLTKITVTDELRLFLSACRDHGIKVALSSWYRRDLNNMLMRIKSPRDHANIWVELMLEIEQWDLLDVILYVDFCNEWPFDIWAPFFAKACGNIGFFDEGSMNWMRKTVEIFKRHYPEIPVTFSCGYPLTDDAPDVSFLDFIEVHTWMATSSDYYHKLGYKYERFTDSGYIKLAFDGERVYRKEKEHFDNCLVGNIEAIAEWAEKRNMPIITTEGWAVVDYKDGPMLEWGWIKELCELGVKTAADTGVYAGIATSNFCEPQFVGMWRDANWHRRLTDVIHKSELK